MYAELCQSVICVFVLFDISECKWYEVHSWRHQFLDIWTIYSTLETQIVLTSIYLKTFISIVFYSVYFQILIFTCAVHVKTCIICRSVVYLLCKMVVCLVNLNAIKQLIHIHINIVSHVLVPSYIRQKVRTFGNDITVTTTSMLQTF